MLDDKEAVQQLERQRRHSEEIKRDNRLAVILQECQPSLGYVAASVQASQIARDGPFRDDIAELLQLAVDLRRSPVRVLVRQASDQTSDLLRDLRSATVAAGTPMPIEPEAGAVPSDDRLGLDDDEAIGAIKRRPTPFAFQNSHLLTECEDLNGRIGSTPKEDTDRGEKGKDGFAHELTLLTCRNAASQDQRRQVASC